MTDREPWGVTLAALARRATTAELAVAGGDQRITIRLEHGRVADAISRAPADSVLRIALLHGLIQPRQIADLERVVANADDAVAALKLPEKSAAQLRRHVILHRVARTFALEAPTIELRDVKISMLSQTGVDLRAPIYLGARRTLSEQRLADELSGFGSYFVLQPNACIGDYGFVDDERPVLDTLASGATLDELVAKHREVDPRRLQAMVYALACCRDLTGVDRGRAVTSDFGTLAAGTQHGPRPVLVDRRVAADAALQRATRALGGEQPEVAISELTRAIELDPETVDYRAMLAWARFCAAKNKRAIASEVRGTLTKIVRFSHRPEVARFYLGRVERMLGNDREALVHFQEVLALQPRHAEASVEVRFILQRLPALADRARAR